MSDVLVMAAGEFCDPVFIVIQVETDYRLLHVFFQRLRCLISKT